MKKKKSLVLFTLNKGHSDNTKTYYFFYYYFQLTAGRNIAQSLIDAEKTKPLWKVNVGCHNLHLKPLIRQVI